MIVTMVLHEHTCPNDGQPVKGVLVANVRVNLHSLRTLDTSLYAVQPCDCGYAPDSSDGLIWRCDEKASAKIEAAREKLRARRKKAPARGRG